VSTGAALTNSSYLEQLTGSGLLHEPLHRRYGKNGTGSPVSTYFFNRPTILPHV
jgi:hypothetical protein